MKWKVIRLELASSGDFPRGSVGRTYLIRLPISDSGAIDADILDSEPALATVRRYWPSEADMLGSVVRTNSGLAIRYDANGARDPRLFGFGANRIKLGERVVLTEPDGRELPFRVAGISG